MDTGHARNVAQFNTIITVCTLFGAKYNPVNPNIQLSALSLKYTSADGFVKAVRAPLEIYAQSASDRLLAFHELKHIVPQSFSALKSSANITGKTISDAQTLVDKITGANITKHRLHNPEDAANLHSVSQQSYDMMLSNFNDLISVYSSTNYLTNEPNLTIPSLATFAGTLLAHTNAVNNAFLPYKQALKNRDTDLYLEKTGLFDLSKAVKDYIKSNGVLSATEKHFITSLDFHRPKDEDLHF